MFSLYNTKAQIPTRAPHFAVKISARSPRVRLVPPPQMAYHREKHAKEVVPIMNRMDRRDAQRARRRRTALAVLAAALALLLLYSLYRVGTILWTYGQGEAQYDQVARSVATALPTAAPEETAPAGETAPAASPAAQPERLAVDFSALQAINPDACAWLYGQGASLHYPVVQGEDNEYYLNHLLDGTRSACGCLFVDAGASAGFSDRVTIVYGHNMNDGSMFGTLDAYKSQEAYDANTEMQLLTPEGNYRVELLAGMVTDPSDAVYGGLTTEEEVAAYVESALARSTFQSSAAYAPGDRLLALSTCSYETDDSIFLVIGRLSPLD